MSFDLDLAKRSPPRDFTVISKTQHETEPLEFEVEARVEKNQLVLTYRLTNLSIEAYGVLNRIATGPAEQPKSLDPSNAYFSFRDGHILHIEQFMLPYPQGFTVAGISIPGTTILEPRSTLKNELRYELPAVVNHPYEYIHARKGERKRVPKAQKSRLTDQINLSLGVYKITSPQKLREVANQPGVFFANPNLAGGGQFVLTAKVKLPEPIPVLDYELVPR